MSNQLDDIEKRLQQLIEVHLVKYLPGSSNQDQIALRMAEALRLYTTSPNLVKLQNDDQQQFKVVVHPSTLELWQKDTRLIDGLNKVFRLVAGEMNITFSNAPISTVEADPSMGVDGLEVRATQMESVAETQNMPGSAIDVPIRAAFLIIGGTKVFTLDHPVTNLGRRLDNHLVVDDPRVSRYHAQIRYVRGRFIIFDLNSTGGTFVNGQRNTQSVLYPGDVISLAGLPIVFGQDNPPPSALLGDTAPLSMSVSERKTVSFDEFPPPNENR